MNNDQCLPGSYCPNPSKYEIRLFRMLKERGIVALLNYWDGKKRIDLAIPGAHLYVQVDPNEDPGATADQDMNEDPADETFHTIRIGSRELREEPELVAGHIANLARSRMIEQGPGT